MISFLTFMATLNTLGDKESNHLSIVAKIFPENLLLPPMVE